MQAEGELQEIRKQLQQLMERKPRLQETQKQAEAQAQQAEKALEAARAQEVTLEARRKFPTEEIARARLAQAEREDREKSRALEEAQRVLQRATNQRHPGPGPGGAVPPGSAGNGEAAGRPAGGISAFLPGEGHGGGSLAAPDPAISPGSGGGPAASGRSLQKRREAAESARKQALTSIAGRPRPDMAQLQRAQQEIQKKCAESQERLEKWRSDFKTNRDVKERLREQTAGRARAMETQDHLNALYDQLTASAPAAAWTLKPTCSGIICRRFWKLPTGDSGRCPPGSSKCG